METRAIYILTVFLLFSGCSRVPPPDDRFVSSIVQQRINSSVGWRPENFADQEITCFITSAIGHELTADIAIQIALLNNPKIQAFFEDLEISRADLVEAGLLSNPAYEIEVRYPHVKGLKTNIEYLITTSLLDIFLIPLRTRLANTEFEQTKLKVSNEILDLAFEVRKTFYELIAQRKKIQYIQSVAGLTGIISDISSKQLAIGNVNSLEFQLARARFLEAELELSRSQAEMIRLSEKLNRLLGFTDAVCLILPNDLPAIDNQEFDICLLEKIALNERLDLQVARFEVARLSQMLGLKEWWTYTNLKVGVAGEREPDGANLVGPGFSGELPLFNYGQAARMRLFAQLRQAQDRLAALEIQVLSEVREVYKILLTYRKILNDYQGQLLPMQGKISASSAELYNVMGLGLDKLLENKRLEVVATQNYTESQKNYLVARVELDRALGGYLFLLLTECMCGVCE